MAVLSVDVVWTAEFAAKGYVEALPADQFPTDGFLQATVDSATYFNKLYAYPSHLRRRSALLPQGPAEQVRPAAADHLRRDEGGLRQDPGGREERQARLLRRSVQQVRGPDRELRRGRQRRRRRHRRRRRQAERRAPRRPPRACRPWPTGSRTAPSPRPPSPGRKSRVGTAFQNGKLIFHRNWGYVYSQSPEDRRLVQGRRQVRRRSAAGYRPVRASPAWVATTTPSPRTPRTRARRSTS